MVYQSKNIFFNDLSDLSIQDNQVYHNPSGEKLKNIKLNWSIKKEDWENLKNIIEQKP